MPHTPFFVTPYPTKADIEAADPKAEEKVWREMPLSELEYLLKAERRRGVGHHWAYCENRHRRMWKIYLERKGP